MENLDGTWSGKISGTNNAAVFVEIAQNEKHLSGTARINDHVLGLSFFTFSGRYDGDNVILNLMPKIGQSAPAVYGNVKVKGVVKDMQMSGRWESTIGTAGTFNIQKDNI
jgi:hypothetical protein